MMRQVVYLSLFLVVCFGCKKETKNGQTLKTNVSNDTVPVSKVTAIKIFEKQPYFKANGNEPFWSLQIFDNIIVFKTPSDSIKTPHVMPVLVADSNIKIYKMETEAAHFNIQISQQECINSMSGMKSPYAVSIDYKKTIEKDLKHVEGCGEYIIDYRLHDIWVLEELNGKKVTKDDFSREYPSMEINTNTNKFFGFAGCNRMNGNLFFEKDLLRFTNVITTRMMCEPNNKENEFLKALQSSISYKIENNRLVLSNPDGVKLVFKKID